MPGTSSHQRFCDLAGDEIARLATAVDGAEDQSDAAAPTVTVRAPTADLYLFLWGRRRPTHPGLTVTGDADRLTHRQQHAVI